MTSFYTELKNRTVISVTGADAAPFLQGLITNDIDKAGTDHWIYSCFLTPQGKFLFDFFILKTVEGYLLDVEKKRYQEFLMRLTMFKLRSDVELNDCSDQYEIYAFWGSGETLGYSDPRHKKMGTRMIVKIPSNIQTTAQSVDFSDYDQHRLTLGVPDGSRDMIPQRSGMLESNMDRLNALDWEKGCYMGQELTARTHYRGLIKRRLMPFLYEGDTPEFGDDILYDGQRIGQIRSTCNGYGLALMKIEAVDQMVEKDRPAKSNKTTIKVINLS